MRGFTREVVLGPFGFDAVCSSSRSQESEEEVSQKLGCPHCCVFRWYNKQGV